ncbi:MAG: PTS sugar transporter subunit IIB [Brevinemataceae bacterium]
MKILVCCISGMGSSQIIKMKIKNVLEKLNLEGSIEHKTLGEAKSIAKNYDLIFCSLALVDNFKDTKNVMGLKNLLSETEIETALKENGLG